MIEKKLTTSGAKAQQQTGDTTKRVLPYSQWHRTLDRKLLMCDVDFIEWRYRQGQLVPVAIVEATTVDLGILVNEHYVDAILYRYNERDLQGKATRVVAHALQVPAFIVLFREDCSEFWVHRLTGTTPIWHYHDPASMADFLQSL